MSIKRPKRTRIDLPATVTRLIPEIKIPTGVLEDMAKLKGHLYGVPGCAALAYGIARAIEPDLYTQQAVADAAEIRLPNLQQGWQRVKRDEQLTEILDELDEQRKQREVEEIAPIPE